MNQIFEYTDYRAFLKDIFSERKKSASPFSHRYLALKLGLATPNLIMLIMQGKRNLTDSICFKLIKFLKLGRRESRYFEAMVGFAQSKSHEEKDRHFSTMLELRSKTAASLLEKKQYDYYSNWYNLVIRELVTIPGWNGDYRQLAKMVSPPILPKQAERSVALLIDLGLIKKKDGGYIQLDPVITTGPEANSIAVANYHRKMAELAAQSYDRHQKQSRTITACTLALTEEDFIRLKKEIADFRAKAMDFAQDVRKGAQIYQINFQAFPVSRKIE
jgi:uncharacterized protein (TIGR02147 family)